MRLGFLAFGALVLCNACLPSDHAGQVGLREESVRLGLALVEGRGDRIAVIPFDSTERYYTEHGQPAFSGSGRVVAWHDSSIWGPTDLIVNSIRGEIIAKARAPYPDFYVGSINEEAGLLEFWGTVPGDHHPCGLHWATFDLSRIGFIDSLLPGDNPFGDWSPDGRALVYAKGGVVHVFDMRSQHSRALLRGRDPTWAPDGKRISFRGQDALATLATLEGEVVRWPVGSHKPLSPLRWTPDGRYVDFSEAAQFPLFGEYYRNVICRVSDGKTITARSLGIGWPDLLGFHWILDYRDFCRSCRPGEPFGSPASGALPRPTEIRTVIAGQVSNRLKVIHRVSGRGLEAAALR